MSLVYALSRFASVAEFTAADQCPCDAETDATLIGDALDNASDILARLSGMRMRGVGTVTGARPNMGCDRCGPRCITLIGPVIGVTTVYEDGVLLVAGTDYQLHGDKVFRVTPEGLGKSWGWSSPFLPTHADNTVEISYTYGRTPGRMERIAAFEVACDLLSAWAGGAPPMFDVDSISGGGVSITRRPNEQEDVLVTADMPAVARFVARWNPSGSVLPNEVFAPELIECGSCSCW